MSGKADLRPGATYLLDDFTVVQVMAVDGTEIQYRTCVWTWAWRRRVVTRRCPTPRLARRVRTEVSGDFFPDIAVPGLHRFRHSDAEREALDDFLAERARLRMLPPDN